MVEDTHPQFDGYIYAYGGAEGFNGNTEYTVLQSVEKATFINYGTTGRLILLNGMFWYSGNWTNHLILKQI